MNFYLEVNERLKSFILVWHGITYVEVSLLLIILIVTVYVIFMHSLTIDSKNYAKYDNVVNHYLSDVNYFETQYKYNSI